MKRRERSVWGWKYPVQAILDREAKLDSKCWFHAHELFADVFAVYAIGPAYAYSCLLLRPGSRPPTADSPNHPTWNERYFVMLETLQRIALHGGASRSIVDDIARRFAGIRAFETRTKAPDTEKLRSLFCEFYPLLDRHLQGVRYSTFGRAQQLVSALADDTQPIPLLTGVTVADVLNAAWLARIGNREHSERTRTIEARALEACRRI